MKKFKAGQLCQSPSICDSDCIFEIKILTRTEKTAMILDDEGRKRRVKIHIDPYSGDELIQPDRFSMAPVYKP